MQSMYILEETFQTYCLAMGDKRWMEEKLTEAKLPHVLGSSTNEMAEHYGDRMSWTNSDCRW